MNGLKRAILAFCATLALPMSAFAQCPVIPALPDVERRTEYTGIVSQTGPFLVQFQLYGDSTDTQNWLEVWVNSTKKTGGGVDYTVTTASGPAIGAACLPIQNAQITFNVAQTGTIEIVGARRPRRASQVSENRGVTAHDFNQIISDLTASQRERWDWSGRVLRAPAGETLTVLPPVATRASQIAAYDASGNPTVVPPSSTTPPAPNTVTNSMLAQMAATTTKCNLTGGLASPTDCSVANMISMLGVPALNSNNTWTGTNTFVAATTISGAATFSSATTFNGANTFVGDALFKDGRPWADVRAYGAVCNGSTDDTTAIAAAITAVTAAGGVVFFPPGVCKITSTLTIPGGIRLVGSGIGASQINGQASDFNMLHFTGNYTGLENIFVAGDQSAASTASTVIVDAGIIQVSFRECNIWGGKYALQISSTDSKVDNCFILGFGTTGADMYSKGGQNWYHRVKFDDAGGAHSFGVLIDATGVAGTLENNFIDCDFSGNFTTASVKIDDGSGTKAYTTFSNGTFSNAILLTNSKYASFSGSKFGANITLTTGDVSVVASTGIAAITATGGLCAANKNITC